MNEDRQRREVLAGGYKGRCCCARPFRAVEHKDGRGKSLVGSHCRAIHTNIRTIRSWPASPVSCVDGGVCWEWFLWDISSRSGSRNDGLEIIGGFSDWYLLSSLLVSRAAHGFLDSYMLSSLPVPRVGQGFLDHPGNAGSHQHCQRVLYYCGEMVCIDLPTAAVF